MSDRDDRLLRDINRRNWIILSLLSLASLFWLSKDVTLGVIGGSLVAIIAHHWRYRSLVEILGSDAGNAARRFQRGYIFRLATLGMSLFALIALIKVEPIALVIGLSVVIINIFFTTWQRSF